jgi:DNA-binding Xre family transcriptional regulator
LKDSSCGATKKDIGRYLNSKKKNDIMAKLNRIKVVLAERDLNNKWLAEQVGKDPATVSKWVTNTTQPILEALIAIANVLDVTVQDLVRQEEFN